MKSIILLLFIIFAISTTCQRILEDTDVLSYDSKEQEKDDGPIEIVLSKEPLRLTKLDQNDNKLH